MKSSRLERSNAAHCKLRNKSIFTGKAADVKFNYHLEVINRQIDSGRVLSKAERSKIYKTIFDKIYSR